MPFKKIPVFFVSFLIIKFLSFQIIYYTYHNNVLPIW
nr:MAG TPA: hypothetical protein [Caudoviricetes sp.]